MKQILYILEGFCQHKIDIKGLLRLELSQNCQRPFLNLNLKTDKMLEGGVPKGVFPNITIS